MAFSHTSLPVEKCQSGGVDADLEHDIKLMHNVLGAVGAREVPLDSVIFSGFDGWQLLADRTHGNRRSFYGLTAAQWLITLELYGNTSNQPSSYAYKLDFTGHNHLSNMRKRARPTIGVYDRSALMPTTEHPAWLEAVENNDADTLGEFVIGMNSLDNLYSPKPGLTLDETLVVAIELANEK